MIEKITVDDRELQQALLKFYKTKTPAQVLRSQARLMAVNLAFQTQPFGGSKAVGGQQDSACSLAGNMNRLMRFCGLIDQAVKVGASFTRCQGGHMKLLGTSQWYAFAY